MEYNRFARWIWLLGPLLVCSGCLGGSPPAHYFLLTPMAPLVGTLTSLSVSGNANVGNLTVTGMTDMCGGTVYGIQYEAAITNGGSTQLYSNIGFAILRSNGTIGSHTVIMPATPSSGQIIQLAFANITTNLTQAGSGTQTCNGAWTTANSSQGGTWIYHSVTDAWYRVG